VTACMAAVRSELQLHKNTFLLLYKRQQPAGRVPRLQPIAFKARFKGEHRPEQVCEQRDQFRQHRRVVMQASHVHARRRDELRDVELQEAQRNRKALAVLGLGVQGEPGSVANTVGRVRV